MRANFTPEETDAILAEHYPWAKKPEPHCFKCDAPTLAPENEYGEHICDNCQQNREEAAWERHCESLHDGGASGWTTLTEQQIEARKLK